MRGTALDEPSRGQGTDGKWGASLQNNRREIGPTLSRAALQVLIEEFRLLAPFCLFLSPAVELALLEQEGQHGRTPLRQKQQQAVIVAHKAPKPIGGFPIEETSWGDSAGVRPLFGFLLLNAGHVLATCFFCRRWLSERF